MFATRTKDQALYTLTESAEILGIHREQITRLLDEEKLEGIRTGSRWVKVTRRSLIAFMGS